MCGKSSANLHKCAAKLPETKRRRPMEGTTSACTPSKRRNWSEEEDALLLRQVCANTPFLRKSGAVVEAWEEVAVKLAAEDGFDRQAFDGKKRRTASCLCLRSTRKPTSSPRERQVLLKTSAKRASCLTN
ncbi:hypothetical protein PybrP1_011214 [[Pythium] brassicae (nom. inval.)]|nr:hypothetical protein PybrP1_011214 [[Pythium] brassicae (nom. inval.)]